MTDERKTAHMRTFRVDASARDIQTGADPIRVRYGAGFVEFKHNLGAYSEVSLELWNGDRQGVEDMFRDMTQSEADAVLNGEIDEAWVRERR